MNFKQLTLLFKNIDASRLLFVGLGNPRRGDDGAGLAIYENLKNQPEFKESMFITAGTNPENYLQLILNMDPATIIFIDTVNFGQKAGSIEMFTVDQIGGNQFSTHAFSIKMIHNFLQHHRPFEIKYLGIQPKTMHVSENLSMEIQDGINNFFEM